MIYKEYLEAHIFLVFKIYFSNLKKNHDKTLKEKCLYINFLMEVSKNPQHAYAEIFELQRQAATMNLKD